MAKIVTFGELMLRLSPVGYNRLFQTESLEGSFGGGEANVAVSLAQMGDDAAFVSKFPQNMVGEAALRKLKAYGVNTSHILRGGKRMGIYYMEKGASQRPSVCIYDREGSSFQTSKPEEYCWKGRAVVPLYGDHTGAGQRHGFRLPRCLQGCKRGRGNNFLRFKLSREALEPRGCHGSHERVVPVCGRVYWQRVRCSRCIRGEAE